MHGNKKASYFTYDGINQLKSETHIPNKFTPNPNELKPVFDFYVIPTSKCQIIIPYDMCIGIFVTKRSKNNGHSIHSFDTLLVAKRCCEILLSLYKIEKQTLRIFCKFHSSQIFWKFYTMSLLDAMQKAKL